MCGKIQVGGGHLTELVGRPGSVHFVAQGMCGALGKGEEA